MQKFTSIGAVRNLVTHVRRNSEFHGRPIPTINFEGTVKLHGTNAGVRITEEKNIPQSRERIISIGSDNAGFAQFVANKDSDFVILAGYISAHYQGHTPFRYTIFGEWCGGNIQSKVGLNSLDKHFVVFNVFDHETETYLNRVWMDAALSDPSIMAVLHDANIYLINELPPFRVTIDFTQPEQSIEELERLTLQVEDECPWAKYRGATGIGEGIVWVNADEPGNQEFWFKTKGLKHQGKGEGKVKTLNVDPVKAAAMRELVEILLPEWRLEQGIAFLRENGYDLSQSATGNYLQWVMKDVLKEEEDTIAANEYDWKSLTGPLTQRARQWYFEFLRKPLDN